MFILLTYLGRKSLGGGATRCSVLDSVLGTLTTLLSPLTTHQAGFLRAEMDLSLIGWILLFLSVCLDTNGTSGCSEEMADKSKDRDQGRVVLNLLLIETLFCCMNQQIPDSCNTFIVCRFLVCSLLIKKSGEA